MNLHYELAMSGYLFNLVMDELANNTPFVGMTHPKNGMFL